MSHSKPTTSGRPASWIGLAMSAALLSGPACALYEPAPAFEPVPEEDEPEPEGPPCDPIEGLARPVYVCLEQGYTEGVLFVDPQTDVSASDGSLAAPVATLGRALEIASEDASIGAILIAGSPTISAPVRLTQDVSLLGGYDAAFAPDAQARPRLEGGPDDEVVFVASGLDEPVVVRRIDIHASDAGQGASAAVLADQVELILDHVQIEAGAGHDGIDGDDGAPGAPGQAGQSASGQDPGEPGTNEACPGADGSAGGMGGDAVEDAQPGAGGLGGAPGQDGAEGMAGQDGAHGDDATEGRWTMAGWQPGQAATDGEPGEHGPGGGGGGGGMAQGGLGGGGGGGGAGGCGGAPGTAGSSGYPSAGIVAIDSQLRLRQTRVRAAHGGDAGRGGVGGPGGMPEQGGLGASGVNGGQAGGDGAPGQPGSAGGDGGSGRAGSSWAIWCVNSRLRLEQGAELVQAQGGRTADMTRAPSGAQFGCDMP